MLANIPKLASKNNLTGDSLGIKDASGGIRMPKKKKDSPIPRRQPLPPTQAPVVVPQRDSADNTSDRSFLIVGIGASAGGLEALEGFFANLPTDSRMAL